MGDSNAHSVSLKSATAPVATQELGGTPLEEVPYSETSICTYPEDYYALLQASFKAIEALRIGEPEAIKMLTEAQACEAFPQELKTAAQKALAALPK